MALPPVPSDRDIERLRLLSIFHYIYGALEVLGIGFIYLHYSMMRMIFTNPQMLEQMRHPKDGQPMPFDPADFIHAFVWFYVVMGVWFAVMMVLNLLAAGKLRSAKSRTFIIVVSALNCLGFPFGTALGVFTLVVVMRDSVRMKFEANEAAARA